MYGISVCYFPVFFQLSKHASMQPRLCREKILSVTVYTPCRSNFQPYFDPDFSVHSFQRLARHLNFLTVSVVPCERNTRGAGEGGLAVRSGTEFTWSPQLRNSAEWDWVQIFLENKYGGECRHGRAMSFCSVLSFPADKYQERFLWTFLMDLLDIRRRDVWTVHGWLHLSWFGISASSVIFKLREFSSVHLAPFLIFFHLQWY